MLANLRFSGPAEYRFRAIAELNQAVLTASLRRALKGPSRPGWNWVVESGTQFLRRLVRTAFSIQDVESARRYLDAVTFDFSALSQVSVTAVNEEEFRGHRFAPRGQEGPSTVLYLHGGGYSFYPRAYANFIALVTLAAKSPTFALDYRLSPEYRFPAQLEDATKAYLWLLNSGVDPEDMIVAGDSAGGNLTLALLLALRDSRLPQPALAIALSPPTDFRVEVASLADQATDWIDRPMLERWAGWFCDPAQQSNPLVSPILADLRNLAPIYIQAGRAEVLYPGIQAFVEHARKQGADIRFDDWAEMNHDFQLFGPYAPQSADALEHLGEVVEVTLRNHKFTTTGR